MSETTARGIASAIREGRLTARAAVERALARIASDNQVLNAFTTITAERARARADAIDASEVRGPLCGVPFAAKNLFDIEGVVTRAGSALNAERKAASRDAFLIERLEAAGAILVGALNMGEYAYDFTGENAHDGAARNPLDHAHMTGGSSSGSAGAIASGMVPLTLASDTNGSIRVPSSFCGLYGIKPSYGRLSRARSFPFVTSLDHLGPLAADCDDLALCYDTLQGADPDDPVQAARPVEATSPGLARGLDGLRVARLGGYFRKGANAQALAACEAVARALGATAEVELAGSDIARASAYLITASEGAALHLERLRATPGGFDPDVRDRLIAGAMIPAAFADKAQRFRRLYHARAMALFDRYDLLIAPSTPFPAPRLGERSVVLGGETLPLRPNIGIYTQPISFIGLPVAAVPVWGGARLPIGVQIIAPPWREDLALRAARVWQDAERAGERAARSA